jgi:hypothetical protein
VTVTAGEPVALNFNALSRALAEYNRRIVRSGKLAELRGAPYTVLGVLIETVGSFRDSARIFTATGKLVAWPSRQTIARRSGYKLAAVAKALSQLIDAGAIGRAKEGGGRTTTGYELLPPPDADSPDYWRSPWPPPPVHPSRRVARARVDGCRPPEWTAGAHPSRPHPSTPVDPDSKRVKQVLSSSSEGSAPGAAAAEGEGSTPAAGVPAAAAERAHDPAHDPAQQLAPELAEQLARLGMAPVFVGKLAGRAHVTAELIRRAWREAQRKTEHAARLRLLFWLLEEPGRVSMPPTPATPATPAERAKRAPAADDAAAQDQRRVAERIHALAAAGKLAELHAAAVADPATGFHAGRWAKINPADVAAVARNVPLCTAILTAEAAHNKRAAAATPPAPPADAGGYAHL